MKMIKKRGIMGIATLIIFIATILVAAVAAGVLISTSSALHQKSLLTAYDAKKKITAALDVISLTGKVNRSDQSVNNFEYIVQLSPGSEPLQMKKTNLYFVAPTFDNSSTLMYPDLINLNYSIEDEVNNNSWLQINDIDNDGNDDFIKIVTPNGANNKSDDLLAFNLTQYGIAYVNLTKDLSNASNQNVSLDLENKPIETNNGMIIGFVSIKGETNKSNAIISEVNFTITDLPTKNICNFNVLPPESRFCFVVLYGNQDSILEPGEKMKILYRNLPNHKVYAGEKMNSIFTVEGGRQAEIRSVVPDTLTTSKVILWPIQ